MLYYFCIGGVGMSKSYNYNNPDNDKFDRRKVTTERLVTLAGLLYELDRLKLGLSKMCYRDPRVSSIEKVKRIRMHRIMIKK